MRAADTIPPFVHLADLLPPCGAIVAEVTDSTFTSPKLFSIQLAKLSATPSSSVPEVSVSNPGLERRLSPVMTQELLETEELDLLELDLLEDLELLDLELLDLLEELLDLELLLADDSHQSSCKSFQISSASAQRSIIEERELEELDLLELLDTLLELEDLEEDFEEEDEDLLDELLDLELLDLELLDLEELLELLEELEDNVPVGNKAKALTPQGSEAAIVRLPPVTDLIAAKSAVCNCIQPSDPAVVVYSATVSAQFPPVSPVKEDTALSSDTNTKATASSWL